jgi:dTMP kinase
LATEGLKPDLTVLFDLPVGESNTRTRRRASGRHSGDRLDAETEDFHTRVRDAYLKLARAEPERIKIIQSNQPVDKTHEQVKDILVPFLTSRGHLSIANTNEAVTAAIESGT